MEKLVIKQGEAKTVTFTVTDADGAAVDLSAAAMFLGVKKDKSDAAYTFSHADADFDKTQAASGIVSVELSAADTDQPEATYIGELRCAWDGPVIKKSEDFFIQVKRAVTV
jgi:ribosomal protein S11